MNIMWRALFVVVAGIVLVVNATDGNAVGFRRKWPVGSKVKLVGLQRRDDLNQKVATVIGHSEGRCQVKLEDGSEEVAAKHLNVVGPRFYYLGMSGTVVGFVEENELLWFDEDQKVALSMLQPNDDEIRREFEDNQLQPLDDANLAEMHKTYQLI